MSTDRYNLLKQNADTLIEKFKAYNLVRTENAKEMKEKLQKKKQLFQENAVKEKIKPVAIDAVITELVTSQIKEAAIQELNSQIQQLVARERERFDQLERERLEEDTINAIKKTAIDAVANQLVSIQIKENDDKIAAKQIIGKLIKKYLPLIRTIIAIKKAAINVVKNSTTTKSIEEQLQELLDQFEEYNKTMIDTSKTEEERKNAEEERKNTLETYKTLVNTISDKDKQIAALQTLLEKLENIAMKTTLSSLHKPPVAESKELLIKNAAINAVKDALIAELSKKFAAQVSTPSVTTPPAVNIENDLKNAALTALYRALLGVPREPVDISKKPDKYDVLITDKTYKYDEKGQPVEEKELTKYDSILAK
jgi:hypothetical protein